MKITSLIAPLLIFHAPVWCWWDIKHHDKATVNCFFDKYRVQKKEIDGLSAVFLTFFIFIIIDVNMYLLLLISGLGVVILSFGKSQEKRLWIKSHIPWVLS
ncbi:MAG: hypothetical protein JKY55_02480 [Aliivibrio sp.]|uniref:hypothetical protein n=1 Tax=Aliivibrio sp. TaxID=1872443 RepID=UPI001A398782|nr:hypothetical protein [Aliivibrio sp.]